MIVVDTQMLMYAAVGGPQAALAGSVRAKDAFWVSPPLWRSEMRNALAGYLRRGEMSSEQALASLFSAAALLTDEHRVADVEVLRLVALSKCSAYDLEFVALAEALGVLLVTNDRQVLDAFPGIAVRPEAFAG